MRRSLLALGLLGSVTLAPSLRAQAPRYPERAIRRDIPLTDMIRRAFAAGTREPSGRPGPHYWQLWTDYTIAARLDPATGVVTGHERVVVQNASDTEMNAVTLRLDKNLFGPGAERAQAEPDLQETDGMRITALSIDGQAVDPNPQPTLRTVTRGGQTFQFMAPPPYDLRVTSATIPLATPVPAHGSFTLEADWHFTVPKIPAGRRGVRMGAWGDSLFQVAQWYPRVAVIDDLREGGWDAEPYLGPSEFYNNFGHFDVKLDVPAGWLVARPACSRTRTRC